MTDAEAVGSGADVGPLGQAFAREVRRRRELHGLSQTDLALQLRDRYGLKFHQATIDRVEKAVRPCRLDEVYAIAEVLGSSVDDMLDDWSKPERALAALADVAQRAQSSTLLAGIAVKQNLTWIEDERERVQAGLARRDEVGGEDPVGNWGREVLDVLDQLSTWAAGFTKTAYPGLTEPGGRLDRLIQDILSGTSRTNQDDDRGV